MWLRSMAIRSTLLVLVLVLSVLLGNVSCERLYVATNGSNSNPGTSTDPLADLATAVAHARYGDTIYFSSGTFTGPQNIGLSLEHLNIVGSSDEPTIFQSDYVSQENAFCMNITFGRMRVRPSRLTHPTNSNLFCISPAHRIHWLSHCRIFPCQQFSRI